MLLSEILETAKDLIADAKYICEREPSHQYYADKGIKPEQYLPNFEAWKKSQKRLIASQWQSDVLDATDYAEGTERQWDLFWEQIDELRKDPYIRDCFKEVDDNGEA